MGASLYTGIQSGVFTMLCVVLYRKHAMPVPVRLEPTFSELALLVISL